MAEQRTFQLVIASVGETRFDGPVVSATFPSTAGEMTVLSQHEPIVTTLKKGSIIVRLPAQAGETTGSPKKFDVEGGVLECAGNRVVVLL